MVRYTHREGDLRPQKQHVTSARTMRSSRVAFPFGLCQLVFFSFLYAVHTDVLLSAQTEVVVFFQLIVTGKEGVGMEKNAGDDSIVTYRTARPSPQRKKFLFSISRH